MKNSNSKINTLLFLILFYYCSYILARLAMMFSLIPMPTIRAILSKLTKESSYGKGNTNILLMIDNYIPKLVMQSNHYSLSSILFVNSYLLILSVDSRYSQNNLFWFSIERGRVRNLCWVFRTVA